MSAESRIRELYAALGDGDAGAAAAALEPVAAPDAPWRIETDRLVPADGLAVVLGHLVGRPPDGQAAPRCRFVHVWTLKGDRATRVEVWIDPLAAARARLAPHPLAPTHHPERISP